MTEIPAGLSARIAELFPGARIVSTALLAPDRAGDGATIKADGYGLPRRIEIVDTPGRGHVLVFRTQSANEFGHDRRADRAAGALLAFDTFGRIPRHVRALDVGAHHGRRRSALGSRRSRVLSPHDVRSGPSVRRRSAPHRRGAAASRRSTSSAAAALAGYLVELHAMRGGRPAVYPRAIRDLVGSGEGIFGIIDGYPADTPGGAARAAARHRAPLPSTGAGGCAAAATRWRRTHGDFHPFNVVFGEGADFTAARRQPRLRRRSRRRRRPRMAVNYVFFALDRPAPGAAGFARAVAALLVDVYLERQRRPRAPRRAPRRSSPGARSSSPARASTRTSRRPRATACSGSSSACSTRRRSTSPPPTSSSVDRAGRLDHRPSLLGQDDAGAARPRASRRGPASSSTATRSARRSIRAPATTSRRATRSTGRWPAGGAARARRATSSWCRPPRRAARTGRPAARWRPSSSRSTCGRPSPSASGATRKGSSPAPAAVRRPTFPASAPLTSRRRTPTSSPTAARTSSRSPRSSRRRGRELTRSGPAVRPTATAKTRA